MKVLGEFFKFIIEIFIKLFEIIKNIVISIDYKSIYDSIISFFSLGDGNLALELIGYEVTLITLYFVFLPLIIENKDKETYLGHRVSKWILYERIKNTKLSKIWFKFIKNENLFSDMCISWINNIVLIIISVILYILEFNLIVILLFMIFIIFLGKKVVDYLSLTSSDSYKEEIENNFLDLCVNDNEKLSALLRKNKTNSIDENKQTLSFILKNYDVENMDNIYKVFYKDVFDRSNIDSMYMIFSLLSDEIQKRKKDNNCINLFIDPWDLNCFLIYGMRENNINNVLEILSIIINNSIELSMIDNDNYNEILAITYSGILKNNIINEESKRRALRVIFSSIKYSLCLNKKDNSFIKYKYIFNLYKYFIDKKDKYGLEFMINDLKENIDCDDKIYYDVIITIIVYLYYLIKVEKAPYVEEEEKGYLNNIYIDIKNIVSNSIIESCYTSDVNELFKAIKDVSHFWERFIFKNGSTTCVKTPVCDDAIIIAKRTLFILFKSDLVNNIKVLSDEDLNTFRYTIEDEKLKDDVLDKINEFAEFIGFTLEDVVIKNYIDKLLEYATNEKRGITKENKSVDYFKNEFDIIGKKLYDDISKLQIFNCENLEEIHKYEIPLPYSRDMFEVFIKQDISDWIKVDNIIESKILEFFSNKNFISIDYDYYSEDKIYKKLKSLSKQYYYIRPSADNLGTEHKFGKGYLDCISKFNIVDTSVGRKRFIVDDYRCCLKNIRFEIRELNNKEISTLIKKYKKGNNYYVKDDYGYDIKFTKKAITEYCKDKYIYCDLVIEIGIDITNSKGYKFVYKKKKLSK